VKAAVGAQFRHERFESTLVDFTGGTTPALSGGPPSERDVSSVFGEVNVPIVGPDNVLPGIRRLVASLAGRIEHYDDFGTTSNPKLGLVWQPIGDLNLRTTYGTSFRAPDLTQLSQPQINVPTFLTNGSQQSLVLIQYGGNPGLKPETATTWTAGFDWTPSFLKGLRVSTTWFDIDFSNQIGQPALENISEVLSNPAYGAFVTTLNGGNSADVAKVQALLNQPSTISGAAYPASAYGAIIDARYTNSSAVLVRGLDFDVMQTFSIDRNVFGLAANATYLVDYQRKLTPTAAPQQLVSTAGEPVDFKGRFTGSWSRGPFGATFAVNFTDSYRDPVADRTIGSWTTCDLQLRWRSQATSGSTKGLELALSAQNLFDQDPPFYDSPVGVGYDPANATPFGRMASISLAKRW
jgi:iron complex outermembrane receptor protein